ncbi:unannotated protein [freshwater metagenome]|uniref:Unannotated protein n=1 Tax=freshwater metagenome TaxID=449393 RepID=A0A6J6VV20_9ZZZZ
MLAALMQVAGRYRILAQVAADFLGAMAAVFVAAALRSDLWLGQLEPSVLGLFGLASAAMNALLGLSTGLYRRRYRYGSFEEVGAMAKSAVALAAVGTLLNLTVLGSSVPRSTPLIAAILTGTGMAMLRYVWRSGVEKLSRPTTMTSEPAIIFGAGAGADQLLMSMLRDPHSPYVPVALLDDDLSKRRLTVRGVRVSGDRTDIARVAAEHDATTIIIAIPSADGPLIRDLADLASDARLAVRVLPSVGELLDGAVGLRDLRRASIADLLGRREIDTSLESVAGYLTGRRVLITGAGGSIGSELARQVGRFAPAELILLDRDESALHAVQLSIHGRAILDGDDTVIADIRDRGRMRQVFAQHQPEVVFHAAALKHLSLLERHPSEGIKTNIYGTLALLETALDAGVQRFVNISTDKAVNPINVLGATKRISERLTAWASGQGNGTYLSVRFGNVLGSRGSALTTFRAQIATGGPVTVTDRDVTRYFMTIEEAVQLIIQAGALGRDGEALVLDMGQPVRIEDLVRRLIDEAGGGVDVVYTGLCSGEKLHEELFGDGELDERPLHPLVSHVNVPWLDPVFVTETLGRLGDEDHFGECLRALSATEGFGAYAES